ncbi:MAG: response regulator transcription factor [Planctomycetaceae bacterium]|nr:response regulator transcription factor [Planctomycetales bacterium]MCB9926337.1 response regulator transcription factor [Planctomycetaceae bacterium]
MSSKPRRKLASAETEPTAKVFVVDDDPQVRRSIEQLVRSVGMNVVSYASAEEFLASKLDNAAGCLVTDVRMPGMNGLDLQAHLLESNFPLPIIVITGYAEVPMAVQSLKAGAFDFIQKPYRPRALIEIIQEAIESDASHRRRKIEIRGIRARLASLSPRETQVLELLVSGKTTKRIATQLKISPTTVDFHRNNILQKMEADNLVELTRVVDLSELAGD